MLQTGISQAQIKVHSNGYVSVGFLDSPADGLHVKNDGWVTSRLESTNSGAGLQFKNYNGHIWELQCIRGASPSEYNDHGDFKIYDRTLGGLDGYRFLIDRYSGNVGIGKIYPHYKLDVDGDINADGAIRSWGVDITSDSLLKKDFEKINNSMDILKKIDGYTYNFKEKVKIKDGFQLSEAGADSLSSTDNKYLKITPPATKQYGLLSQNVKKVMPDIISVSKNTGYEAINYIALIPVLIEAVKSQQEKIEWLETEVQNLKTTDDKKLKSTFDASEVEDLYNAEDIINSAILYQNIPNPFSEATTIRCYVPEGAAKAMITIYDLQGKQVAIRDLNGTGELEVEIFGNELYAGMFKYALIVNNTLVDTKSMVLTD